MLQAFATDNAAAVKVTGDAVENGKLGGKAAITVTSADESETKTYTVTFNAFTLASLKVIGPTKTEYAIGDQARYRRSEGDCRLPEWRQDQGSAGRS